MTVVACTKAEAIAAVEAAAFTTEDDPPRRIVHSMTGPPVMLGCDMDVESVIAHIESADDSDPERPQIGWVDDSIVAHELVAINGDNRVLWFDVKAPPGTFETAVPFHESVPALVRMPDLTITEARLLARLLELAPVEVSMSRATISDSAAAELVATAQSLRTATLEAITTAERTGTADEEAEQPRATPFERWVPEVYELAVTTWRDLLTETGMPAEGADHLARAALARLAHLEPPLTVEVLR